MLSTDQIKDLHRLYWSEQWPIRKIERHLRMRWRTIKKYLNAPAQEPAQRQRASKIDPFKVTIAEWLNKDPGKECDDDSSRTETESTEPIGHEPPTGGDSD